jgi:beta-fructofuranosidase
MAVSRDGGRTWLKSELNPILVGEPNGLTVTGWRDPYVTEWPALDKARAVPKSLYGMISGGVLKEGPALFLYTVQPNDLSQWNYLGPLKLAFQGQSSSEQTRWSGNLGINWECGNVMTLGDNSKEYNFLLVGTEGGLRPGRNEDGGDPYGSWFVWMAGDITQGESGPRMNVEIQGILDHGVFYAANSYQHPLTDMRVVWGWIKEDSLNLNRREAKGWAGFQALPREVFLYSLHNVTATLKTQFEDISSLTVKQETGESTKTVYTLGIRPLPGTEALRRGVSTTYHNITSTSAQVVYLMPCKSMSFELEAVIDLSATSNQRVGFHLRHNKDLSRRLTIYFDLRDEKIVFDQSQTNEESDIPKDPLCGPFTLFKQRRVDGKQQPEEDLERLRLRIFGDGDVFEIFANDRFALSGVAYLQSDYTGISCFVEGSGDDTVVFESIRIWDDMVNNSAAPG